MYLCLVQFFLEKWKVTMYKLIMRPPAKSSTISSSSRYPKRFPEPAAAVNADPVNETNIRKGEEIMKGIDADGAGTTLYDLTRTFQEVVAIKNAVSSDIQCPPADRYFVTIAILDSLKSQCGNWSPTVSAGFAPVAGRLDVLTALTGLSAPNGGAKLDVNAYVAKYLSQIYKA